MVDQGVIDAIKHYLKGLPDQGIHPVCAVLFGSYAEGAPHAWSDIDIVVIAPEFDESKRLRDVQRLWIATRGADSRIEPVACGAKEWEANDVNPILDMARAKGVTIAA